MACGSNKNYAPNLQNPLVGTKVSAPVPTSSLPTLTVLQPWKHAPCASSLHYLLCTQCQWHCRARCGLLCLGHRPLRGITWVPRVSSWNLSRSPLLAVFEPPRCSTADPCSPPPGLLLCTAGPGWIGSVRPAPSIHPPPAKQATPASASTQSLDPTLGVS